MDAESAKAAEISLFVLAGYGFSNAKEYDYKIGKFEKY